MTFEELLDQAIDLLHRRGRVTYHTLKRQFQLDDDVLEDLKEELIYGQRLAVDADGRMMIWTEAHNKALPPEVVEQVVAKTDGVPLFVEELTKMVLKSGLLQEREERYELLSH